MSLKDFGKYLLVTLILLGVSFGAGTLLVRKISQTALTGSWDPLPREEAAPAVDGQRVNILILGNDARPGEDITRSDTIILASIDPHQKKVVLLFIPRDTKWFSPVHGVQKINAALAYDGPTGAVQAVQDLVQVKIDHYMVVNFEAFKAIIDTLGGVEIDVKENMYKPSENIHVEKGLQVLNGEDALGYVRFRGYLMGDVTRAEHQAVFMKALVHKIMEPATVLKLPQLVLAVNKLLNTDMLATDMIRYASWVPAFTEASLVTQVMPGYFENGYDAGGTLISSYWIVMPLDARSILDDLYRGKTAQVFKPEPPGADLRPAAQASNPQPATGPAMPEVSGPSLNTAPVPTSATQPGDQPDSGPVSPEANGPQPGPNNGTPAAPTPPSPGSLPESGPASDPSKPEGFPAAPHASSSSESSPTSSSQTRIGQL